MDLSENRSYIYQINLQSQQTNDVRIIASNFIEEYSKVLDVGCACGDFGYYLVHEKRCNVYGMEYDSDSITAALSKNVFEDIHQVDLNKHTADNYPQYFDRFDYITLLDVLEHTISPERNIRELNVYLKKDGYFIVSLPNISFGNIKVSILNNDFEYTDTGILDKTHLRFFTYKTIATFFTKLEFEIVECRVKASPITASMKNIPWVTKREILKDPHSHAYQYVLKIKKSFLENEILFQKNREKMQIEKSDMKSILDRYKKDAFVSVLLPQGSKRRNLIKKLYKKIKGDR